MHQCRSTGTVSAAAGGGVLVSRDLGLRGYLSSAAAMGQGGAVPVILLAHPHCSVQAQFYIIQMHSAHTQWLKCFLNISGEPLERKLSRRIIVLCLVGRILSG